ncbi:hypothetical protein Q5P01_025931 [Channa striata]|uniref:Uncharacterized protein n=1 Tax=Channa striata TaxID=64152 RepID=A0AA88ITN5_CHASR|nr:hypothetical protein Q5P01_025931 [Channa striata]
MSLNFHRVHNEVHLLTELTCINVGVQVSSQGTEPQLVAPDICKLTTMEEDLTISHGSAKNCSISLIEDEKEKMPSV